MSQNRGYFLGRLFVLLGRQGALERSPEQLFQLASTAPPQVFPKALATLIEAGKEEELFSIMPMLNIDAFDGGLNRREQGAFAIGYIHERTGFVLPHIEEEGEDAEQELTERYEFRVDPILKEWIKTNGGGALIRSILRDERVQRSQKKASEHTPEGDESIRGS